MIGMFPNMVFYPENCNLLALEFSDFSDKPTYFPVFFDKIDARGAVAPCPPVTVPPGNGAMHACIPILDVTTSSFVITTE